MATTKMRPAKKADPALQFDVDVMILDHLLHSAILALLVDAKLGLTKGQGWKDSDDALARVDDFVAIFNAHHSQPLNLPDLEYRLALLQLVSLFCHRGEQSVSTPSIEQLMRLRAENWDRASSLHDDMPADDLLRKLWGPEGNLPSLAKGHITDSEYVHLLDLLPMFFEVTHMRADSAPSSSWMHLAAELLLQAVIEPGTAVTRNVIVEAFAWGTYNESSLGDDLDDRVTELFWDWDGKQPSQDWLWIRDEYLSELLQADYTVKRDAATELRPGYPRRGFEAQMLEYFHSLAMSVELPVLAQLGEDSMLGLGVEETRALKLRCGL